jgi:acyl-CoA synthetase (AMP-forming)/AMP-acid ligase II
LFPRGKRPSLKPLWINAAKPANSLSPDQVLLLVKRVAVGFDSLGVPEGSTVTVMTTNHIFVPVLYLATVGSKRCFTGVNPSFTVDEIAYQLKASKAAVLLVHPSILANGIEAATRANFPLNRIYQFSDNELPVQRGIQDWRDIIAPQEKAVNWEWDPLLGDSSLRTVGVINFSSGTTGLPKGTCITHHSLVANTAQAIYVRFHAPPTHPTNIQSLERWLGFLPLYHAYSQLWTINMACILEIPTYVMEKFQFEDFLRHIENYRITSLQLVPPVLIMLSKRPETSKFDLNSLNHIISGAAPLSRELQNDMSNRFGVLIAQGWGMTEVVCVGLMIPGFLRDDSGSVGYLLPNSEAKLVDASGNEVEGENNPGEIWFRGPQVMLEYFDNREATEACKTADGWLKTGDIAVVRNGMFTIIDRSKELIKVNGLQVAPAELEATLLQCEHVADAAVVGITLHDEELPRAYVVLQPTAIGKVSQDDIEGFIAARLSKHKRLTGGVAFVNEIPKLASGKILRKEIRIWAKQDAQSVENRIKARI